MDTVSKIPDDYQTVLRNSLNVEVDDLNSLLEKEGTQDHTTLR